MVTTTGLRHPRLEYLDGIRGVAAAMVVVNHLPAFTPTPRLVTELGLGNPWVAIFIALSGFCLYLPSAKLPSIRMPRAFPEFMWRRALRILPAWYASLVVCIATGAFLYAQGSALVDFGFLPINGWDIATHLTMTHSMTGYSGSINGPGYTLGTEWQLYLLMLPFLWFVARWGWLPLLLVIAATALPIPGIPGELLQKVFSPTFTVPFILGMLSARLVYWQPSDRLIRWTRWVMTPVLAVLVGLGSFGFLVLDRFNHDVACWAVAVATGAACILMARHPRALPTRVFSSLPAKTLGSFAYSLYLTHFPLLALGAWTATALAVPSELAFYVVFLPLLPIVLIFAYVFYRIFERPFIDYMNARPRPSTAPTLPSAGWSTAR